MAEVVAERRWGAQSAALRVSRLTAGVARQRELSLLAVMVALGVFVFARSPQFLSAANLSQVTILAAIIAVAAVGEALVILTRNVDLSVDSTIGLVAYSVADILRAHALGLPAAIAFGIGLGLVLGVVNGTIVTVFRVPAIVATLGTLSVYRGCAYLIAGGGQISLSDLPPEYIALARATPPGLRSNRSRCSDICRCGCDWPAWRAGKHCWWSSSGCWSGWAADSRPCSCPPRISRT